MARGYFITGTDTGVGKTWVSVSVLYFWQQKGYSAVGMKPVAAGCEWVDGQLKNADALLLQQHSSVRLAYARVNPYAYERPISPHLAGADNPVALTIIEQAYQQLQTEAEVVVVEGAGGWHSPLSAQWDNADLAKALNVPVILVVAIRLGCINQAKLSMQAIEASGVECAGWVAVCNAPDELEQQEVIAFIQQVLPVACLGVMPYSAQLEQVCLTGWLAGL